MSCKMRKRDTIIFLMMSASLHRKIVVVRFPTDIEGQIDLCKDVVYKMNHSDWINVADVQPSLGDVATAIGALDVKSLLAGTHSDGTAEARMAELNGVKVLIFELSFHVQKICDKNPGHEKEIAQTCGMDIKRPGGRKANEDSVNATGIDKQVRLTGIVLKGKRCNHEFQVSLDPSNPDRWHEINITVTKKAARMVDDLPIDVDLYFRHRLIDNDIPQAWGQLMHIKLTH